METENIKEKFGNELKWASYFIISTIILSLVFVIFNLLFLNQNNDSIILLYIFVLLTFIYISIRCYNEIKDKKRHPLFEFLIVITNIFFISFILNSFLFGSFNNEFIIPRNELTIQETNEDLNKSNNNLLNDFINLFKK
jgi:NADH:ubiquinone oxidoreductase subunit 6 (subunit J)